jgi:nucleoside-diphosphate-sugar epimerase
MNILLTGGAGFIGTNLTERLLHKALIALVGQKGHNLIIKKIRKIK